MRWLETLPGSRAVGWACGAEASGRLGLRVHTGVAAWDKNQRGPLSRAPSGCCEKQSPKLNCVCQHFTFCPCNISSRVWSETSTVFQSSVSLCPGIAKPWGLFSLPFSRAFVCSPLAGLFPSRNKVEFPDGNRNYKHMLLLSAAIGLAKL